MCVICFDLRGGRTGLLSRRGCSQHVGSTAVTEANIVQAPAPDQLVAESYNPSAHADPNAALASRKSSMEPLSSPALHTAF